MPNSQKRTALITGGGKRIGAAIALSVAKRDINVAIHYNSSQNDTVELQKEIKKLGVDVEIFQADLNQNCYEKLIKDVVKRFPNLDILINNASIFEQTRFLETTNQQLDDHLNINFKAPFFLTQHFAKIQKKGLVINMLDSRVAKSSTNYFSYLLSKKILEDFTLMAAKEFQNIRINAISPGITELYSDISEETFKRMVDSSPLKRAVKIEEITKAVNLLIENDSFTGQNLFIDSGANL